MGFQDAGFCDFSLVKVWLEVFYFVTSFELIAKAMNEALAFFCITGTDK